MELESRPIILVYGGNQPSREAEEDLLHAGFAVVSTRDPRSVLVEAGRRPVAALIIGEVVPYWFWRRWRRAPGLRQVPIVVLISRHVHELLILWPFGAFVRGHAYVSAAQLEKRGVVAEALRTAIHRGASPLERFGEALWYVGSTISLVGLLLMPVAVVAVALMWSRSMLIYGALSVAVGTVLMDVGGIIGLRQPLRLRWRTWMSIAAIVLIARFL